LIIFLKILTWRGVMEIADKFENLKQEYIDTLNRIKDIPEASINDMSKIIYNDVMNLGNKTLETWLNEKAGAEYNKKKL
jgi:hypothetical protein